MFPELTPEQIHERVAEHWDLSGPVPVPKKEFGCGRCHQEEWQLRSMDFFAHNETGHRVGFRVNVNMKCTGCGVVDTWGIPITEEYYRENHGNGGNWRRIQELLLYSTTQVTS